MGKYHTVFLGIEVPTLETVLINRPTEKATGAGETVITVAAVATGNAIFDGTGARRAKAANWASSPTLF